MATRSAEARWEGTLKEGTGNVKVESGAFDTQFSYSTRFAEGTGTNPEEMIGAALAGCYSMQLNSFLHRDGYQPGYVHATANVRLNKVNDKLTINIIDMDVEADVSDINNDEFQALVQEAKEACIISRVLNADINIDASLKS